MANSLLALNAILTSTLTTTLVTAPSTQEYRISHIIISATATASAVTLSFTNSSSGVTTNIISAAPIAANRNIELFDLALEPNDSLQGGASPATDIHFTLIGVALDK